MVKKIILRAMRKSKFGKLIKDEELTRLANRRIKGTITRNEYDRKAKEIIRRKRL